MTGLIELLEEAIGFLERYQERVWSKRLRHCSDLIGQGDVSGLEKLLQSFGGWGTLNDLVLCPENNHVISEADTASANTKLEEYRRGIYRLASDLRRDSWKR
ncbi:MAG TPA: hypothetical protein PLK30_19520 [Blastocatellia bacterium]|nr:hypothetical protein [Blastocatellia bacterium]